MGRAARMFTPLLLSTVAVTLLNIGCVMAGMATLTLMSDAIIVGICSLGLSIIYDTPVWWRYINTAFVPFIYLTSCIEINPNIFLVFFILRASCIIHDETDFRAM